MNNMSKKLNEELVIKEWSDFYKKLGFRYISPIRSRRKYIVFGPTLYRFDICPNHLSLRGEYLEYSDESFVRKVHKAISDMIRIQYSE